MNLLEKLSKIGPPDYSSFTLTEKQELFEAVFCGNLTADEQFVITRRMYGNPYKEIADLLKTTRDPIRAIEAKALQRIRTYLASN